MHRSGHITWEVANGIGILSPGPPPDNLLAAPAFIPVSEFVSLTSLPELRGLIIHGQGRHFSAGADLKSLFTEPAERLPDRLNEGKELLEKIATLPFPAIAAIRGACFGGGLEIALACHIRICTENALFAFPEVNHGLLPGLGGTVRVPLTAGRMHALALILGGDVVNAGEALAMGLVDRIVPGRDALGAAVELLDKMTRGRKPEVIRAVMQSIRNAITLSPDQAMREETALFAELAKAEASRRKNGQE